MQTFTNHTDVAFNILSDNTNLRQYFVDDVYLTMMTGIPYSTTVQVTCSTDLAQTLTSSLGQMDGETVPSWLNIDFTSFVMTATLPVVTSNTMFKFRVNSQQDDKLTFQNYYITVEACGQGDEFDVAYNSWQPKLDANVETLNTVSAVSTTVGVNTFVVVAILTVSSPQGAFSMMNQQQLLLLLPLIGTDFPDKILQFIKGMDFALMNFQFLSPNSITQQDSWTSGISKKQEHEYLFSLGLESTSTLINQSGTIVLIVLVALAHVALFCVHLLFKTLNWSNWVSKLTAWLFKIMTFGFYIRFTLEIYMFLFLSISKELHDFDISYKNSFVSIGITILIAIALSLFVLKILIMWVRSYDDPTSYDTSFFYELFNGLKQAFWPRFFVILFLLKRTLMISILIFCKSYSVLFRLWAFWAVQVLGCIIMSVLRPFSELQSNIVDIMNECFFTLVCLILFYFDSKSKWNSAFEWMYISILMSANIISTLIAISFLSIQVRHFIKKWLSKRTK